MPTISVIVPAYNVEKTLLETIESIRQQTFTDFELIVINDGSTDRTLEILNAIDDSRLKVFSYENAGLSTARNRGISHATGEFITFIDADDLWTPDKLELQLAALRQNPDAGIAYSWTSFMDETGKYFFPDKPIYFEGDVLPQMLARNFIASGSNVMARREAIESVGMFDPQISPCADWDYYLRLAMSYCFTVVPKHQVFYRQSSSSMSTKIDFMEQCTLSMLTRAFQTAPPELQHLKGKSFSRLYQYLGKTELANATDISQVRRSTQKLLKAIRLNPLTVFSLDTQRYLLKLVLMKLLTPKFAIPITQLFSQVTAESDPRF